MSRAIAIVAMVMVVQCLSQPEALAGKEAATRTASSAPGPLSPQRKAKLLAALGQGKDQVLLFRRACREADAAGLALKDSEIRTLLAGIEADTSGFTLSPSEIRLVMRGGKVSVTAVEGALRGTTPKKGSGAVELLCILAQMGPVAAQAAPTIDKFLKSKDAYERSSAEVAMAAVMADNDRRKRLNEAIRKDASPNYGAVVLMSGRIDLLDPTTINALCRRLVKQKDKDDDCVWDAALGSLGEKAPRCVRDMLRERYKKNLKESSGSSVFIISGLSFAAVSPCDRAKVVREVAKKAADWNHTHYAALMQVDFAGLGKYLAKDLDECLKSNDPEVLEATLLILAWIEVPPNVVQADVLRLLETHPDKKVRSSAAAAIAMLGDEKDLSRLKRALGAEKEFLTRGGIGGAISVMDLEPVKEDKPDP